MCGPIPKAHREWIVTVGSTDVRHEADYKREVPEGALVHVGCEVLHASNGSIIPVIYRRVCQPCYHWQSQEFQHLILGLVTGECGQVRK